MSASGLYSCSRVQMHGRWMIGSVGIQISVHIDKGSGKKGELAGPPESVQKTNEETIKVCSDLRSATQSGGAN